MIDAFGLGLVNGQLDQASQQVGGLILPSFFFMTAAQLPVMSYAGPSDVCCQPRFARRRFGQHADHHNQLVGSQSCWFCLSTVSSSQWIHRAALAEGTLTALRSEMTAADQAKQQRQFVAAELEKQVRACW